MPDVRREIAARLAEASKRWHGLAQMENITDAHECRRVERKLMACVSILRAPQYATTVDDDFLQTIRGKSATVIASAIGDRFPKGLPGYADE